jgi:hypothetical protein
MGERRGRSQNAGRLCEKHWIIIQSINTKTQIGTKKERTKKETANGQGKG